MLRTSKLQWLRRVTLPAVAVAAAAFWLGLSSPSNRAPLLDIDINELLREPIAGDTRVVLIVGTQCPYTRRSVPFYQTLLRTQPKTSFLVAGYETPEVLQAFVNEIGMTGVPVAQLTPAATKHIGATPTLLYLSSRHIPTRVWVGLLGTQSQETARAFLEAQLTPAIAR